MINTQKIGMFENTKANALQLVLATMDNASVIPVFDLDGVAIDATHRQICNPDGSLNLAKYREMSTAEHISKDKELPMLYAMQRFSDLGKPFFVCTARVLCVNTRQWLQLRGVNPTHIFSRDGESDHRRDYLLKQDKLTEAFTRSELKRAYLVDDNEANCKMAAGLGMAALHMPFDGH
tara:strand:+ start:120 stop:653 length:534 start_codon:yes stop_codon:yes gene_type:complete